MLLKFETEFIQICARLVYQYFDFAWLERGFNILNRATSIVNF
jgi:hypothetical protein